MEGNGGKARHGQRRCNGGGLAEELKQREDHRREQRGQQRQRYDRQHGAGHDGKPQERIAQGHDLLLILPFAYGLAHQHRRGGAQTEAEHQEEPVQVPHHCVGRQHFHGVLRVAQYHRQQTVAKPPPGLVQHHRRSVFEKPPQHVPARPEKGRPPHPDAFVPQGVHHADEKFADAGAKGGDGRPLNAQHGKAQLAENQQVVQPRVDERGGAEQLHAEAGILGAALGAGIHGGEHVENIGDADELQIRRAQNRQLMVV